jgi:hypothetical protein
LFSVLLQELYYLWGRPWKAAVISVADSIFEGNSFAELPSKAF